MQAEKLEKPFYLRSPYQNGTTWRIDGNLYGTPQAPRNWYITKRKKMEENGWQVSPVDPCLFSKTYKRTGENIESIADKDATITLSKERAKHDTSIIGTAYVGIHVDDGKAITENEAVTYLYIEEAKEMFEQKNIAEVDQFTFLGDDYCIKNDGHTCTISQERYITSVVENLNLGHLELHDGPMRTDVVLQFEHMSEVDKKYVENFNYRGLMGCTISLLKTRPELNAVISKLGSFQSNPNRAACDALEYLWGHLIATKSKKLVYERGKKNAPPLSAYSDASFNGEHNATSEEPRCKSRMGGVAMLFGNKPIWWNSAKIPFVVLSTTEAEYIALVRMMMSLIWISQLIRFFDIDDFWPIEIQEDNKAAIELSKLFGPKICRTKHIDVKYHFIRDRIARGEFVITYCNTKYNLADIFTKVLPVPAHQEKTAWLHVR